MLAASSYLQPRPGPAVALGDLGLPSNTANVCPSNVCQVDSFTSGIYTSENRTFMQIFELQNYSFEALRKALSSRSWIFKFVGIVRSSLRSQLRVSSTILMTSTRCRLRP